MTTSCCDASAGPTVRPESAPGAPFFTVTAARLVENVHSFRTHLPGVHPYFAVKANPEPPVLAVLAAQGVGFEAASLPEIELLRSLGVDAARVLFGSAIKPTGSIAAAYTWGVRLFAVDSADEVDKLAKFAPGSDILVRIRVNDARSTFAFGEKFGAEPSTGVALVHRALSRGLTPIGFSFHVGSQSMRVDAWAEAVATVQPLVQQLADEGVRLRVIDIGGGFPCQYDTAERVPTLEQIGVRTIDALRALPGLSVIAEPGRFLVGSAVTLTTTVISRVDRLSGTWLFTDAGCYNGLFEAMSYQGSIRYPVSVVSGARSLARGTFHIAGPTGDSADVVARDVCLPVDTGTGCVLVFENAGAYTMSLCVPFNGFAKPTVHLA